MPRSANQTRFLEVTKELYGDISTINRAQVVRVSDELGIVPPAWLVQEPRRRVARGVYSLNINLGSTKLTNPNERKRRAVKTPAPVKPTVPTLKAEDAAPQLSNTEGVDDMTLVPKRKVGYVPFGNYADVRAIIASEKFYPFSVTGLSGNGKTDMVREVCAVQGRELIRANITKKTDEDELLGGFRLVNGNTVWQDGPVLVAMERGAVLLLDEVDLGDAKLMCLQPVLEGESIYIKSVNKVVRPAPGFNVVSTANTKGKGSDDGRFIGTNVMNEAFLDRFPVTFEQEYPPAKIEEKILDNLLQQSNIDGGDFSKILVQWADMTRQTFYQGGSSELISTRRLVHIVGAYSIFGQNRLKAIELCLNRFDNETKNTFLEGYKKFDGSLTLNGSQSATVQVAPDASRSQAVSF